MRLQDVYGLSVKGMANGVFQPTGTGRPPLYSPGLRVALSADDCFHVGKVAVPCPCFREGFGFFSPPPFPHGGDEASLSQPAGIPRLRHRSWVFAASGFGVTGRVSRLQSGGERGSPGGILGGFERG